MDGEDNTVKLSLRRYSKRLQLRSHDHQTHSDEYYSSSRGGDGNGTGLRRSKRLKYGSGLEDSQGCRQSLQRHSHRENDRCGDNKPGASVPAGGVNILDFLNRDCWRLVLEYIPINDIVRSERVSRAWQRVVLDYLPGVKLEYRDMDLSPRISYLKNKNRIILCPKRAPLIKRMIRKLAPFLVTLESRCIKVDGVIFLALHCPKLESLTLRGMKFDVDDEEEKERTNVDLFITGITPEEMANSASLKNLKTLTLNGYGSNAIVISRVRSFVKKWSGLAWLGLNRNALQTLENVHLLLKEMPNLEHLSMMHYYTKHTVLKLGSEVAASVGGLSRLRELRLGGNENVTDEWLVAAARGCPELRVVDVGLCWKVSRRAVLALCRARPNLVHLDVTILALTDNDLVTVARCCKDLEFLNASNCSRMTGNLPARLAWPRARPLRMRVWCTVLEGDKAHYEGLILTW